MTKTLALLIGLFTFVTSYSQSESHVKWVATYKSFSATEGEITIMATIDKDWHTYSQEANNAVPFPTLFSFKEAKDYQLVGKTEEKTHTSNLMLRLVKNFWCLPTKPNLNKK